jgi:hypothetical protein
MAVAGLGGLLCFSPALHATLHGQRWGHHPPARHGPPLCARRPAGWPGGVASCSRRVREAFPVQGVWEA